jgi:hypothetical protein
MLGSIPFMAYASNSTTMYVPFLKNQPLSINPIVPGFHPATKICSGSTIIYELSFIACQVLGIFLMKKELVV